MAAYKVTCNHNLELDDDLIEHTSPARARYSIVYRRCHVNYVGARVDDSLCLELDQLAYSSLGSHGCFYLTDIVSAMAMTNRESRRPEKF
jgi:hypothetical protein